MRSINKSEFFQDKRLFIVITVVSVVSVLVMILYSALSTGMGFPLDDAWIHQTYARALATEGKWNYSLNGVSAGSTSPLWTVLLVPGYWMGFKEPYLWTFLVTVFFMGLMYVFSMKILRIMGINDNLSLILSGIVLATEWHLIWATGSGMETIFFTALVVVVIYLIGKQKPSIALAGLAIGILVWIRPDGLTLIGPVGLTIFFLAREKKLKPGLLIQFALFLLIPFLLYGWHNVTLTGTVLPNTYFAKALEYQEVQQVPFLQRFGQILLVPLTGSGFLLLPGFLYEAFLGGKKRDIWKLSVILWIVGFLLLYAVRLPVVYQHGRYLIPVIPLYFIFGLSGLFRIIKTIRKLSPKLVMIEILSMLLVLNLAFLVIGVKAYSRDVVTINRLMVQPAKWLKENTPSGSIIAAHDIGAIGYYSERQIIDLAALINPEVIPFIRDEEKLIEYIERQGGDYLVILSDWYQTLGDSGDLVKSFDLELDGEVHITEIRTMR